MSRVLGRTVCSVAGTRLLNKALQLRKEHAGSLLKTTRVINAIQITGSEDFGVGCHTASFEPCFVDAAYQHVKRDYALPIDENSEYSELLLHIILGNLLHHVNDAVRSSSPVDDIDEALCAGDFHALTHCAPRATLLAFT